MSEPIDPRLSVIDDSLFRCATRAIIVHNAKLLLVKDRDVYWWSLPGGGIEYGESTIDALARELNEELGLKKADFNLNDTVVLITTDGVVDGIPRLNIHYRVEVTIESIAIGSEIEDVKWLSIAELEQQRLSPSLKQHIQELSLLINAKL